MTRRELFLAPLALRALWMAMRSLPAKATPSRASTYSYFGIDVAAHTDYAVMSVWEGNKLVETVRLQKGRQMIWMPLGKALNPQIRLEVNQPAVFHCFKIDT